MPETSEPIGNPGSLREALLDALRRGDHARAATLAGALEEEVRTRADESREHSRLRALRLVLELNEAAGEGGIPAEQADAAAMRAAGEIVTARRDRDVAAALRFLLHALFTTGAPSAGSGARITRRAAAYIERNYRRNLTLAEVAGHVGLSPAYFSALFAREQGTGFLRFLRNVRLTEARRLLRETQRTVEDVANAVGYEDAHYFTRIFTREMGMPPGRYREQQRAAQEK